MQFKNETGNILHVCITDEGQNKATVAVLYPNCVASYPGTSTITYGEQIGEIMPSANASADTFLDELPDEGSVAVGYYKYQGKVVFCRQDHERTIYPPEETPALFYFFRENPEGMEWIEQEMVEVGNTRTYEGDTYTVLQAHVTEAQWQPDITPALWQKQSSGNVWEVGIAVTVGEEYWYPDTNGTLYRVLQSHTTQAGWTPPAVPALWEAV